MYFFGYKSFDVVKIKNVVVLNLTFPSSNSFLNYAELTKLGFEYFLKQFQRCKKKLFLQRNTLFHIMNLYSLRKRFCDAEIKSLGTFLIVLEAMWNSYYFKSRGRHFATRTLLIVNNISKIKERMEEVELTYYFQLSNNKYNIRAKSFVSQYEK